MDRPGFPHPAAPRQTQRRIRRLLVANRGEIACRIMRTTRDRGIHTIAVFSDADRDALHVRLANEAIHIGSSPVPQSYLSIDNVIAAARAAAADAIHPGYGFLSENAVFAEACAQAGIIFVGPSPAAIRDMGDKAAAKRRMEEAGVPCVPGYHGRDQSDETLVAEAERIGFPIMVKSAAGGGGRGMRLVTCLDDLPAALQAARSEAKNAFGDDTLLIERAILEPRHIEIQVFGDMHGNVVHLGERDCSVQRRHQKVIEESPSPAVDAQLRERMGAAAVRAARAIGYVGAGTIEFLLGADGRFYFLEMNTRLQVEHPVTELVTGLDLVGLQLDVAQGRPLPFGQDDIDWRGSAIEVRLYAEDPSRRFMPQVGPVHLFKPAKGQHVRTDHGLSEGVPVMPFYDAMLAKVIAWGDDRAEALARLAMAVEETVLFGVTTNREFLLQALNHPGFIDGSATTAFIAEHFPTGFCRTNEGLQEAVLLAALIAAGSPSNGWSTSHVLARTMTLRHDKQEIAISLQAADEFWMIKTDAGEVLARIVEDDGRDLRASLGSRLVRATHARSKDRIYLQSAGRSWILDDVTLEVGQAGAAANDGLVRSPLSGLVRSLSAQTGSAVRKGQVLAVIEAMKMEHNIVAFADGVIESVSVRSGAQVAAREVLMKLVEGRSA